MRKVTYEKSLEYCNPELAKEWHPTKNKSLKPSDVSWCSGKKVWWYLSYDDLKTGKHFDFEWEAIIASRVKGNGCPYLKGRKVLKGYNDLETLYPELAAEWHPTKNNGLKPDEVTTNSNKKVWWYLPYDDPKTGKHFDFEWEATISNRVLGNGCPYIDGKKVLKGYNDLATLRPELAKEWHPTKNNGLRPDEVAANSNKRVWWYLSYDDPKTGKHFDFEWEATISKRGNCPYLWGQAVWKGYNDLATLRPDLAKEWHPTKNGTLTPDKVTCGSKKIVWWMLEYYDPILEKNFLFEWKAKIGARTLGGGCPYLTSKAVWAGFNDLKTVLPDLALEWDEEKNIGVDIESVPYQSQKERWWKCKNGHSWKASPGARYRNKKIVACPYCTGARIIKGENDLFTFYPELEPEWDFDKNKISPYEITPYSNKYANWKCKNNHSWKARIGSRAAGNGCPYCAGKKVMPGENDLQTTEPETMTFWDYIKNRINPAKVTAKSIKKAWWKCEQGHSWRKTIASMVYNPRCPICNQ